MGFLKNIFSTKQEIHIDLSFLGTDIHSHYIPHVDDGSNSFEESLILIKEMKALGYKKLITTPHIQTEFFKNNSQIILNGLSELRKKVQLAEIEIEIEAAAEYLIDDGFEKLIEKEKLMTFSDNYLLVELSYFIPYPNLFEVLFNLQLSGYKVVLAHPERYTYWFNQLQKYEELKDRGILFQLNINSLAGYYDPIVQKTAEKLIKMKYYDLAGSDMHNTNYLNGFKEAIKTKAFETLVNTNPLINNKL